MDPVVTERLGVDHPLAQHIGAFLTDLPNANSSGQTIPTYRGDLTQFAAHHDGEIGELTAAPVRAYLSEIAGLAQAGRGGVVVQVGGASRSARREPDGQDR